MYIVVIFFNFNKWIGLVAKHLNLTWSVVELIKNLSETYVKMMKTKGKSNFKTMMYKLDLNTVRSIDWLLFNVSSLCGQNNPSEPRACDMKDRV